MPVDLDKKYPECLKISSLHLAGSLGAEVEPRFEPTMKEEREFCALSCNKVFSDSFVPVAAGTCMT
jgi:hypothetical protein